MKERSTKANSRGLDFTHEVKDACNEIIEHPKTWPNVRKIISSISKFGEDRGFITGPQASMVGKVYKQVIHNGKYVHHDWWPDQR